jgi:hypothetical protein
MEGNISTTKSSPSNGGQEKLKLIDRSKVAEIQRLLKGAGTRIERLERELNDIRSILKRGYAEKTGAKGAITQIPLKAFERETYRNKRVMIEQELALAKRDYLVSNRAYKKAISNNFRANKLKLKAAKKDNGIRRISKTLFKKMLNIIELQAKNGGKEKFNILKSLSDIGDVKGFRKAFDELGPELDNDLYITSSGVSEVKTEIIHGLMEELASRNTGPIPITFEPLQTEAK